MAQLAEREEIFREALPIGADLTSARAFLREQGIAPYEYDAKAEEPVLEKANVKIVAEPGDHVLSALVPTEATEFPCWYRIEIVLVLDLQEKIEHSYITRSPLCP